MTDPYCGLSAIFCGFISHLIGHETINNPEIFSSVHSFMGKTKGCLSYNDGAVETLIALFVTLKKTTY